MRLAVHGPSRAGASSATKTCACMSQGVSGGPLRRQYAARHPQGDRAKICLESSGWEEHGAPGSRPAR